MSENAKAMVLASFVGDALALGPHWEYDPAVLVRRFGQVTGYATPAPDGYHAGKKAGELTHYGDQTLVLLRSLADCGGFSLDDFADKWRALFAGYAGYVDGATRMTLKIFEFGEGPGHSGSSSNDLAGASRVAPLVYALQGDLPALVEAAREQTRMTHNHAQVLDAAEFFVRTAWEVLAGQSPVAGMEAADKAGYSRAPIDKWLADGLDSAATDTVAAIGRFGRSCHIGEAMPGVVHLLARHGRDLAGCLTENVMAGGDSAARGLLAGMVLGAANGLEAVPGPWLDGLVSRTVIERDLAAIAG
jgi:ADP-ribosylglycohydrolase